MSGITGGLLSDYMQIRVEQQKALYYIFTYRIHANTLKVALFKNFKLTETFSRYVKDVCELCCRDTDVSMLTM